MKRGQLARDIDEYISWYPEQRDRLEGIRATVRMAAPGVTERISYAIPTFELHGRVLYFAAFRNHISVYPAPRGNPAFQKELAQYAGGKGTLQLPHDRPIPYDLIRRIVEFRVADNAARASGPGARKAAKKSAKKGAAAKRSARQRAPAKKSGTKKRAAKQTKAAPGRVR